MIYIYHRSYTHIANESLLNTILDIKDYRIILMDATVASGAAAMMAIRVLLDHEVPEENINLVSLLMAESGVHTIAYAFPKVKIVTTAVDPEINDKFYVLPGIGNFANRYFGTEPHIILPSSISNFNRQQSSSSQTSLCSKHPNAKH